MSWTVSTAPPRVTSIDREYYDEVVEGMRAAVTGSTGSATCRMVGTILPGVEACGKTVRHKIAVKTIRYSWDSLR